MTKLQKQSEILDVLIQLRTVVNEYTIAIVTHKDSEIKDALRAEIQRIKMEIQRLKKAE